MLLPNLDQAVGEVWSAEGRMDPSRIYTEPSKEGAVQRIRAEDHDRQRDSYLACSPIMWVPGHPSGADVINEIATPMIGGVITSAILGC